MFNLKFHILLNSKQNIPKLGDLVLSSRLSTKSPLKGNLKNYKWIGICVCI